MDGSYLYRKYRSLTDAREQVAMPDPPSRPLTGWKLVLEETYRTLRLALPLGFWATRGNGGECQPSSILPCALYDQTIGLPSMRIGLYMYMYHVYLLLGREGELATTCSATCECAAG